VASNQVLQHLERSPEEKRFHFMPVNTTSSKSVVVRKAVPKHRRWIYSLFHNSNDFDDLANSIQIGLQVYCT